DREPQAPERDVIRYIRRPDGTEEDGIDIADRREAILRHHEPMLMIVVRAPVERPYIKLEAAIARCERIENLEAGRDDLLADAVARNGRDSIRLHASPPKLSQRHRRDHILPWRRADRTTKHHPLRHEEHAAVD